MSGEILFLAHRMPFPPDRGDKIRSHNVLRHLASLAPVHVATFADNERDLAHERELAVVAASHCLVRRTKPLPLAGIEAMIRNEPVSLAAFRDARLSRYVAQVLASRPIAAIYVFSGQMGQYVPGAYSGRVVMDFVDVDSAKFEAYADRHGGARRLLDRREARLLAAEEARLAARADVSLLVSAEEAALMRGRLPQSVAGQATVSALPNGIDTQAYDPDSVGPEPALLEFPGQRLIFTGQMDYPPNVDAALRVIERILPRVRRLLPQATFHVVGRNPVTALRVRNGQDGVHIWGAVPDVRPWLAAADLALVPLDIARGVQNKVLEAMAMGLPVLASPAAATGIGAEPERHLAVAESDVEFAERAAALLVHPHHAKTLGAKARRFLIAHQSWPAALAPLAGHLGLAAGQGRRAA